MSKDIGTALQPSTSSSCERPGSRLFDPEMAQLFVIVLIERVWCFGRVDGDLMSESGHLPNLARDERLIQLREFGKSTIFIFSRVSQESADAALSTRRMAA